MSIDTGQRVAPLREPGRSVDRAIPVRGFRPDIQGMRAVAVLLVVLYHATVPFLTGGFIGVDVFFVISGFLITQHLLRENLATGTVSLSRFYARRIRRLLPSALLVILVTVIAARIWGPALQATSTARDGVFATFSSINYWLASEGVDYQHAASAVSPLQHFWSLAVEEQFYLIWPVIILIVGLLVRRRSPRVRTIALLVPVVVIGGASLHESIVVTAANAPLAYFSLQTRGWELAVGALIAIAGPQLARIPNGLAAALSWIGIAAIVGSAFVYSDSTAFPGAYALVPVLGAALVITAGLVERRGSVERILRPRVLQFLGTVSYGWYLWHWPLIVLGPSLFRTDFGWAENLEVSFLALWLATLSYLILERSVLRRILSRRRWYLTGAIASVLVGSIGLALAVVPLPSPSAAGAAAHVTGSLTQSRLTAELRSAVATKAIPSNLDPTLTDAVWDEPVTSRDGCHVDYTVTTNGAKCVFGDVTASRTIVLFGDSHAQQWFGALDIFAQKDHWRLVSWTKSACPIADLVLQSDVLKRSYTECGEWRARTLKDMARLRPAMIIASQADSLAGPGLANDEWAAQTAVTMTKLNRIAPSLLLGDTPHPTQDIPSCLAAHVDEVAACNIPSYATSQDFGFLGERRAAVARELAKVDVPDIDPLPWFCTATSCPVIVGDLLVYRDNSHMTQAYSNALEPVLVEALTPHLPKRTS